MTTAAATTADASAAALDELRGHLRLALAALERHEALARQGRQQRREPTPEDFARPLDPAFAAACCGKPLDARDVPRAAILSETEQWATGRFDDGPDAAEDSPHMPAGWQTDGDREAEATARDFAAAAELRLGGVYEVGPQAEAAPEEVKDGEKEARDGNQG